jgi:hypothetical protein
MEGHLNSSLSHLEIQRLIAGKLAFDQASPQNQDHSD